MTREDVLERFCSIAGHVRDELGGAADCFCGGNSISESEYRTYGIFEYDEKILAFIEDAVGKALGERRTESPSTAP